MLSDNRYKMQRYLIVIQTWYGHHGLDTGGSRKLSLRRDYRTETLKVNESSCGQGRGECARVKKQCEDIKIRINLTCFANGGGESEWLNNSE